MITWKLSAKGGVASVHGSDPLAGSGFRACLSDVDSVGPSPRRPLHEFKCQLQISRKVRIDVVLSSREGLLDSIHCRPRSKRRRHRVAADSPLRETQLDCYQHQRLEATLRSSGGGDCGGGLLGTNLVDLETWCVPSLPEEESQSRDLVSATTQETTAVACFVSPGCLWVQPGRAPIAPALLWRSSPAHLYHLVGPKRVWKGHKNPHEDRLSSSTILDDSSVQFACTTLFSWNGGENWRRPKRTPQHLSKRRGLMDRTPMSKKDKTAHGKDIKERNHGTKPTPTTISNRLASTGLPPSMSRFLTMTFVDTRPPPSLHTCAAARSSANPLDPRTPASAHAARWVATAVEETATSAGAGGERNGKVETPAQQHSELLRVDVSRPRRGECHQGKRPLL